MLLRIFLDIIGNGLDSIMRVFLTIMALVFVSLFFHTVRNLYFFFTILVIFQKCRDLDQPV